MSNVEPKPTVAPPPFRVLVVEDERTTFTALIILLKHYRFTVNGAETLADARRMIADGVDLICLDLTLPDGDGIDLLSELKAAGSKIPVIVITGTDEPERLARVRELKPEKLLKKPINFLQMLDVIKRHADATSPRVNNAGVISLF